MVRHINDKGILSRWGKASGLVGEGGDPDWSKYPRG